MDCVSVVLPAFQLITPASAKKRSEKAVPEIPREAPSFAVGIKFPAKEATPLAATWNMVVPAEVSNLIKFPAKEAVEEATIKSPVVEVAFTWKYELLAIDWVVVAPT